ncbi:hypothetical protein R6Q59_028820 [Mikania micrantha]|uniref:C3H1-type domain-containing protein n=1 Tax=Mikania micrantha TaxID=192012 RepID=A0A5N6LXI0_9ASTR|nr:hypothetical protein E3N88_39548 [Mikania micrantha]
MIQMENQFHKRPRLSESLPNRRTQNKNDLCLNFQRGSCDYGDRCCFAHCNEELRGFENPRSSEKAKLCWRFMYGAKCEFGDKCHFLHVKPGRTNAAVSFLNVDENGDMLQQKQYPWKTKLCNRWMWTGSCKYGLSCCFAHGELELQNQGPNDSQDYAEGGPCKLIDKRVEGKQLKVKWKNNEMISRVYADWINDMPLVFHTI